jgi:hypothetical protein
VDDEVLLIRQCLIETAMGPRFRGDCVIVYATWHLNLENVPGLSVNISEASSQQWGKTVDSHSLENEAPSVRQRQRA